MAFALGRISERFAAISTAFSLPCFTMCPFPELTGIPRSVIGLACHYMILRDSLQWLFFFLFTLWLLELLHLGLICQLTCACFPVKGLLVAYKLGWDMVLSSSVLNTLLSESLAL